MFSCVLLTSSCPSVYASPANAAATLESTANTQDRPITFLGVDGTEIGSLVTDQASEYAVRPQGCGVHVSAQLWHCLRSGHDRAMGCQHVGTRVLAT